MMDTLEIVLLLLVSSWFVFTLAWLLARRLNNYSIVDAVWSLAFPLLAVLVYFVSKGDSVRTGLFSILFVVWGLRLGLYLTRRIFSHLQIEDTRYLELRREYGENLESRFYRFYMFQAISVPILLGPLLVVSQNPDPGLSVFEWLGLTLWGIGMVGESVADYQLSQFRKNPANRGTVCQIGLWNYSRHPNYFFECVIWVGYGTFALGSPWGIITLYAPFTLIYLITRVTGIPFAEKTSLKSKGELYRRYQETTSIFFPLPKRRV